MCSIILESIVLVIYLSFKIYFPIRKKILLESHTKIWTEITDIVIFRKKLLKFLQSDLVSRKKTISEIQHSDCVPTMLNDLPSPWKCLIGLGLQISWFWSWALISDFSWTVDRGDSSWLSLCFYNPLHAIWRTQGISIYHLSSPRKCFLARFLPTAREGNVLRSIRLSRGVPAFKGWSASEGGSASKVGESASEWGSASKGELGLHLKREGVCISKVGLPTPVITSSGGHCSGRCASYWNALVLEILSSISRFRFSKGNIIRKSICAQCISTSGTLANVAQVHTILPPQTMEIPGNFHRAVGRRGQQRIQKRTLWPYLEILLRDSFYMEEFVTCYSW